MITDMENGLIGTIIVKDLSRLGRHYLMVGYYTEMVFPHYGLRFISISDSVDSSVEGNMDMIPFHNLMNDWYARDISRKQRAVIQNKGKSGQRIMTKVIYGYKKDESKNWVIDETAAEVVCKIYELYLRGYGTQKIANSLYASKIVAPSVHLNCVRKGSNPEKNPYIWSAQAVAGILSRQEYCGDTVNFKSEKRSYKDHTVIKHKKEDYLIFPDTHPAIIDRETFAKAQEIYASRRRISPIKETPLFAGLIYCADCGNRMHIMRSRNYKDTRPDCYVCSGYRKKIKDCTSHYIRTVRIEEFVLKSIQEVLNAYHSDMTAFNRNVKKHIEERSGHSRDQTKKEIAKTQSKLAEIDKCLQNLYMDKVKGEISQETFVNLSASFNKDKSELTDSLNVFLKEEAENKNSAKKLSRFYTALGKYDVVDTLTPEIVNNLIDKVIVHEGTKIQGKREKVPNIEVSFIGVGVLEVNEITLP